MQPVVRRAPETLIDLADVHDRFPDRYPHLLASAPAPGRYDILFAYPKAARVLQPGAGAHERRAFFASLDTPDSPQPACAQGLGLPFLYGHFLYFGYELAGAFEPRLRLPRPATPLAFAQESLGALIRDHGARQTYVTAARADIADAIEQDLGAVREDRSRGSVWDIEEEDDRVFRARMRAIQEFILAGDIFQANLSRGYEARTNARPAALLKALMRHNPAPFAALASLGAHTIISASPERLVRTEGARILTQPIAGTCPRALEADADGAARAALCADPKERAEHIMLVDLERNDLGRLCVEGSVQVTSLMAVESYASVHHLVSRIEGRLRPDTSLESVIASLFPGGSITGCPKQRCIAILGELEREARGPYTGSLGYRNQAGDLDLNILIRTLVLAGQRLTWRAGAGIVADSQIERELAETRAKAAGLVGALTA